MSIGSTLDNFSTSCFNFKVDFFRILSGYIAKHQNMDPTVDGSEMPKQPPFGWIKPCK